MFDGKQDIGAPIVEPITTPNAGKVISFPWLAPVLAVVEDVAEGQLPEGAELEGRLDAIATKHKVSVALVRKAFRAEVRKYRFTPPLILWIVMQPSPRYPLLQTRNQ